MSDFLPVTWHIFLAIFMLTCILTFVLIKYSLKPISDQNLYSLQETSMELKGRVTIYSIVGCPHCMKVGQLFITFWNKLFKIRTCFFCYGITLSFVRVPILELVQVTSWILICSTEHTWKTKQSSCVTAVWLSVGTPVQSEVRISHCPVPGVPSVQAGFEEGQVTGLERTPFPKTGPGTGPESTPLWTDRHLWKHHLPVYTGSNKFFCTNCFKAKNTLSELQIPYTDISVDKYEAAREEMKQRTGKATVPQIFFNSHYVGGNAEFQKLVPYATLFFYPSAVADPRFPRGGTNLFLTIFSRTMHEQKEFLAWGVPRGSLDPPMLWSGD